MLDQLRLGNSSHMDNFNNYNTSAKINITINILAILVHNLNTLATRIITAPKVLDKEGVDVDTVFCPLSICMPDSENSKNVNFSPGDRGNI